MSGDVNHGAEPESGGTVNPGFDPLGAGDLDSHSHGGTQLTDWKNFAEKTLEEYLVNCPGTHGVPLPSTGLAAGQEDPSVNVCCYKWYSPAGNIHSDTSYSLA